MAIFPFSKRITNKITNPYATNEQWFLYISLNIFTVTMWSIRWCHGSPEGRMMVLMWSLYLINSFYGAIKWHQGVKRNRELL